MSHAGIAQSIRRSLSSSSSGISPGANHTSKEIAELREILQKADSRLRTLIDQEQKSSSKTTSPSSRIPSTKEPRGFVEFVRKAEPYRPVRERTRDWKEIFSEGHKEKGEQKRQAARCMDCGTPFCQTNTGCPINNLIPEWNELVLTDHWKEAIDRLHKTNNFPEFTGRVCPAPCEGACVAGLVGDPVTIKNMEYAIVDRAWKEGWIKPNPPKDSDRTNRKVAVIGSGPAGLTVADQLNKYGHYVTVFEREDRIGGLLMYGIPTMKLDKFMVDRRVELLRQEGIKFVSNTSISTKQAADKLMSEFDAVVLAVGATKPRDLAVPGRNLSGIVFAMDYLTSNQKDLEVTKQGQIRNRWDKDMLISAQGKDVVVIGGGDTGTDCIGTSVRQYCRSLVNIELMPKPPPKRDAEKNPWPEYPKVFKEDYGHAEVKELFGKDPRLYSTITKGFIGDAKNNVKGISIATLVDVPTDDGKITRVEIPGSQRVLPANLVVLAMGFLGPEENTVANAFGLTLDQRGNVAPAIHSKSGAPMLHTTNNPSVFACGDCAIGQSLVVTAIAQGRACANRVDQYLVSNKD